MPGRVIPDSAVWQLLENANRARSHKQTEPWRFVVFMGAGRGRLAYGLGGYRNGGITDAEEAKAYFGPGPDNELPGFFQSGYINVPRLAASAARCRPTPAG